MRTYMCERVHLFRVCGSTRAFKLLCYYQLIIRPVVVARVFIRIIDLRRIRDSIVSRFRTSSEFGTIDVFDSAN